MIWEPWILRISLKGTNSTFIELIMLEDTMIIYIQIIISLSMLKEKISGFLKLIRIEICIFWTIGFFVSGVLAEDLIGFQIEYLIGFLIIFLSEAGAFAINDYIDFAVDLKNQRSDRPLVLGLISRKTALITAILILIIDLLLVFFLNAIAALFALISIPLFYVYSLGLKKKILVKNLLIAYSYTGTILFGSVVSDTILEPIIIYFAVMGFIIGLGSEIMFDIADVEGDKELGINTIPSKFGTKTAAIPGLYRKIGTKFFILYCLIGHPGCE